MVPWASGIWTDAPEFYPEPFSSYRPIYRLCDPAAPAVGRSYPSYFLFRDLLSGAGPEGERKVALPGAVFSTTGWMLFSLAFSRILILQEGKLFLYVRQPCSHCFVIFVAYICMCILFMGAELNWFWDEI